MLVVLKCCLTYLSTTKTSVSELAQNKEKFTEMCGNVLKELNSAGLYKPPRVYISGESKDHQKVQEILLRHNCTICDGSTAEIIVCLDNDETALKNGKITLRQVNEQMMMVHTCQLPDSFNFYQSKNAAPAIVPRKSEEGPVYVHKKWVFDLDRFNEFPNIVDYQIEEPESVRYVIKEKEMSQIILF